MDDDLHAELKMIECEYISDFLPHGKYVLKDHPKSSPTVSSSAQSVEYRRSPENNGQQEELFRSDNIVVWSSGNPRMGGFNYHKCYSFDEPIAHSLWTTFRASTDSNPTDFIQCLSVINSDRTKILSYTHGGEEFLSHLSIRVRRCWSSTCGLILECDFDNASLSSLFSLSHPCDEALPVLAKTFKKETECFSEFTGNLKNSVVAVLNDPSIMITHDSRTGHSFWLIRPALPAEADQLHVNNMTVFGDESKSFINRKDLNSSTMNKALMSPIVRSGSVPMNSPHMGKVHSPAFLAGFRGGAPVAASSPFLITNAVKPTSTSFEYKSVRGSQSSLNMTGLVAEMPLTPEVCMEFIAGDESLLPKLLPRYAQTRCPASKAFRTTNITGRQYLCLLIEAWQKLYCFPYTSKSSGYDFDKAIAINCLDACCLADSPFMVILDRDSNVVIHSGILKVSRVNFHKASFRGMTCGDFTDILLTNRRVKSLKPCAERMFILGISSDEDRREILVEIPDISSDECISNLLGVIGKALPVHLYTEFVLKWFVTRNGIGTGSDECLLVSEFEIFIRCLKRELGYAESPDVPESSQDSKKVKFGENGSDDDMVHMMSSRLGRHLARCCNVPRDCAENDQVQSVGGVKKSGILQSHFPRIYQLSHLVYEEMKLCVFHRSQCEVLALFLAEISQDLGLRHWTLHYTIDFPLKVHSALFSRRRIMTEAQVKAFLSDKNCAMLPSIPPDIHHYLFDRVSAFEQGAFPVFDRGVDSRTEKLALIFSAAHQKTSHWSSIHHQSLKVLEYIKYSGWFERTVLNNEQLRKSIQCNDTRENQLMFLMCALGIDRNFLSTLPFGVALPLLECISKGHDSPRLNWPENVIKLIGRRDLCSQLKDLRCPKKALSKASELRPQAWASGTTAAAGAGVSGTEMEEDVLEQLFPGDTRIESVRRMLSSHQPVRMYVPAAAAAAAGGAQHEQKVVQYARRTMSLPVARGMLTLCSVSPTLTQSEPIPPLVLSAKAMPKNVSVELPHTAMPNSALVWPQFHNGAAAGLRIDRFHAAHVQTAWVVFNRPKGGATGSEPSNTHTGLLLGLALNGLLNDMPAYNIHSYLSRNNELTNVSLLLGLCCAKRGSGDTGPLMKALTLHITPLLPPSGTELDVPHNVQVASLLAAGMLHLGSGQRHMAHTMLSQIGRPPGPEMENCTNRESYSLAAGLSLGMVLLGKGHNIQGMSDLGLTTQLHSYIRGGSSPGGTHSLPVCYQIREGDTVNTSVTSPGATIATALIFFNSCSRAIADWFLPPDTTSTIDQEPPEHLLLQTMARGLICWEEMVPSLAWVRSNVPHVLLPALSLLARPEHATHTSVYAIDVSLWQALCNIISGACFALGLRFAGTLNKAAFDTIIHFVHTFMKLINDEDPYISHIGRRTVFSTLLTGLVSVGMVMAGSGNLALLAVIRQLHTLVNPDMDYGQHMAVHMALGLLFLGGGRYSLRNDMQFIPVLIAAFYPRFPITGADNRYHLQAFRHLYAIAAEPRLLLTRDISLLNRITRCLVRVTIAETANHAQFSFHACTPLLIGGTLDTISKIQVLGERDGGWHLPTEIAVGQWKPQLTHILNKGGDLFVQAAPPHLQSTHLLNGKSGADCHLSAFIDHLEAFQLSLRTLHKQRPYDIPTRDIRQLAFVRCYIASHPNHPSQRLLDAFDVKFENALCAGLHVDSLCTYLRDGCVDLSEISRDQCQTLMKFIVNSNLSPPAAAVVAGSNEGRSISNGFQLMLLLKRTVNSPHVLSSLMQRFCHT